MTFVAPKGFDKICDEICDEVCDTICDEICDEICDVICDKICDEFCDEKYVTKYVTESVMVWLHQVVRLWDGPLWLGSNCASLGHLTDQPCDSWILAHEYSTNLQKSVILLLKFVTHNFSRGLGAMICT